MVSLHGYKELSRKVGYGVNCGTNRGIQLPISAPASAAQPLGPIRMV